MATIKPSAYKLEHILFTTAIVTAAIRTVKINFSSGSDGLSPLLFKCCCDNLSLPLAIMFTQFLSVSYVGLPVTVEQTLLCLCIRKAQLLMLPITDQFF